MCGIAGFVFDKEISDEVLQNVANSLHHRGPDANGILKIPRSKVAFVHTRLSFFDLSEKANQPMCFSELGISITFNGEIYNFGEIRSQLKHKGYTFITESDTEVILKAWHAWGKKAVDKLEGMFAFAIYESKSNKVFLVRDRFGIKPLYYIHQDGEFGFGSELKALHACRKFRLD